MYSLKGNNRHWLSIVTIILIVIFFHISAFAKSAVSEKNYKLDDVQHIIIIYAENHSFDNLYGLFPGANNLAKANQTALIQLDRDDNPLKNLPPVWENDGLSVDSSYPTALGNHPFQINAPPVNKALQDKTRDLVHRFYQAQMQINHGAMNKFAAYSDAGGLTMGYYDTSSTGLWQLAKEYTLADNFFMGTFGGSFLNHIYLICSCVPYNAAAPTNLRARLDRDNHLQAVESSPASALAGAPRLYDGFYTPDGYAVNTIQPLYQPAALGQPVLPPLRDKTIGDRLSAKNISWAWYAEGYEAALKDRSVIYNDHSEVNFQPHHLPFNYFAAFAPGTKARQLHLRDGDQLAQDLKAGILPSVVFYKPSGTYNQHPGYATIAAGDTRMVELIEQIQNSKIWSHTVIIVTYDDNGGFWDHVGPPKGDRFGPGVRLPLLVISNMAKHHYVDHTYYDTASIIKFISKRYRLEPLPGLRPDTGDLTPAFNF